jgi:hypothetical protein
LGPVDVLPELITMWRCTGPSVCSPGSWLAARAVVAQQGSRVQERWVAGARTDERVQRGSDAITGPGGRTSTRGADPQQTLTAFRQAEAYDGPSLVLAYCLCIAHGIEMRDGLAQQYRAVASGYWPLLRYDPVIRAVGGNPFLRDSPRPRIGLAEYTGRELRYRALVTADPAEAERLHGLAELEVAQRWDVYEEMATHDAEHFLRDARKAPG